MTKEEQVAQLKDLQDSKLPKVTIDFLGSHPLLDKLSDIQKAKLNEYLSAFYKPTDERGNQCLWCGNHGMSWGLVHGVAQCDSCGSAYVTFHYLRHILGDWTGGASERLEISLQYHPDGFSVIEESEDGK